MLDSDEVFLSHASPTILTARQEEELADLAVAMSENLQMTESAQLAAATAASAALEAPPKPAAPAPKPSPTLKKPGEKASAKKATPKKQEADRGDDGSPLESAIF